MEVAIVGAIIALIDTFERRCSLQRCTYTLESRLGSHLWEALVGRTPRECVFNLSFFVHLSVKVLVGGVFEKMEFVVDLGQT